MTWQAIVMWVTATHRELGPFVRENLYTIKGLVDPLSLAKTLGVLSFTL